MSLTKRRVSIHLANIIGKSGALMESLTVASKAARTDAAVLIRGLSDAGKAAESASGKEDE